MSPETKALNAIHMAAERWDEQDLEGILEHFTEDGQLTVYSGAEQIGSWKGRSQLRERMQQTFDYYAGGQVRHYVATPMFDSIDNDEAKVRAYLYMTATDQDGVRVLATGRYTAHVVREGDVWRMRFQQINLDPMPA